MPEVHFNQRWKRYGKWGGFNNEIDGDTPATYPLTYGLTRRGVNDLITKHLKLQPEVQLHIDAIRAKMASADLVLGVHYRGTDTAMHWPFKKIPYETFFTETDKAIEERLKEKGKHPTEEDRKGAKIRIFVATDEQEFLEVKGSNPPRIINPSLNTVSPMCQAMRKRYGSEVIVSYDGSPRLTPDQYEAATEGLTNSPDVKISNYKKGESAVVDAICLALGEHLIKAELNSHFPSPLYWPLTLACRGVGEEQRFRIFLRL